MNRFERDEVGQTDRAKVRHWKGWSRKVRTLCTDLKVEVARVRQVRVRGRAFTSQVTET